MKQFTTSDICETNGIMKGSIQDWIDRGFVTPSIKEANGSGTRNVWSERDVQMVGMIKKGIHLGLSRKLAAKLSKQNRLKQVIHAIEGKYGEGG